MNKVNKDLLQERSKCTFNVEELIHFLDGGEEMTLERKRRGKTKYNLTVYYWERTIPVYFKIYDLLFSL